MKYLVEKDIKKRNTFFLNEKFKLNSKIFSYNRAYKDDLFIRKLNFLNKNTFSISTIKNRCIKSGRAKAVHRFGHLSRIKFRKMASFGQLYGVHKASW